MPGSARRDDLFRKRQDVFTKMLPGVAEGDVRALHRARVASRRLRELVPVLQLDDQTTSKLTRRLRKVTTRLGRVRELDVLLLLLDELEAGGAHDQRGLDRVRTAIVQARTEARAALAGDRTLSGFRRLAGRLHDVLDGLEHHDAAGESGPARGWIWAIDARVTARARRLRGAIQEAGTVYLPERLHDVRIALKKLRYAMELAAEARRRKATPDTRALARAQDLLGRLHDLQVLIAHARQIREAAPRDAADIDRLIDALEVDCRHLHARYLRERAALVAICDRAASLSARRAKAPAAVRRSA